MKLTNEPSQYWLAALEEQDEMRKLDLWQKGANNGDINCFCSLGEYFMTPSNPNYNIELSIKLLKTAAEFGHMTACYDLAVAYFQRDGEDDSDECLKWMCKAVTMCSIPACVYVEMFYADNDLRSFIKDELSPVVDNISNKSTLSAEDCCLKGLLFEYGIIYSKDHNKALENFRLGKNFGNGLCEAILNNEKLLIHKNVTNGLNETFSETNPSRNINVTEKANALKNNSGCEEAKHLYELGHQCWDEVKQLTNKIKKCSDDDEVRHLHIKIKDKINEAEKYSKAAANKGNTDAILDMAFGRLLVGSYKNETGDANGALDAFADIPVWLCKAAEKGNERAFCSIREDDKQTAKKLLFNAANSLASKANKTEEDYYHLSLYYIYGIVFEKNYDRVKALCEEGVKLNPYGKCAEVLSRECYDLTVKKKNSEDEKKSDKTTHKSTVSFGEIFGVLFTSMLFGGFLTFLVSLFLHHWIFIAWPVITAIIFVIASAVCDSPKSKVIVVLAGFIAVTVGTGYIFKQHSINITGASREATNSWLNDTAEVGLYEKLETYSNGNFKSNAYFDAETSYYYFVNDGNSVCKRAYSTDDEQPDANNKTIDDLWTIAENKTHCAVPLGKYYYIADKKNSAFIVDDNGKVLPIDIDTESMNMDNIAELHKKQHYESITNKELITVLHSQIYGNDLLYAFFPEQMTAFFKDGDNATIIHYNLETDEKTEIIQGVNKTTAIVDYDGSRVAYDENDRTVYYYDFSSMTMKTIIEEVDEPSVINYIKLNGDIYVGLNWSDGTTVVYSRNLHSKTFLDGTENYSDTVSFTDKAYLRIRSEKDDIAYSLYTYPSSKN